MYQLDVNPSDTEIAILEAIKIDAVRTGLSRDLPTLLLRFMAGFAEGRLRHVLMDAIEANGSRS